MEQFFPYLQQAGFQYDYSWFMNENDDRIFYSAGNRIGKMNIFLKAVSIRLRDVLRANQYDVIFIQREAFMTGSVFFEKQFSRSKAKMIYDFDDAIWLEDTSSHNKNLSWLKRPSKTADIIRLSDVVIAGNSFLAAYAKQFNPRVHIIPTVIDTEIYFPSKELPLQVLPVCIGWSGSKTTMKHFAMLLPVLKKLKEKFGERIRYKVIGDKNFHSGDLQIEYSDWQFENETEEFNKFDIGLMPLPDDEWSRGKCGFKALLYMSLEIPPVISPVGVNTEIVQHGINGFLADTPDEWMTFISMLIESPGLRKKIGAAARQTVLEKYSVQSQLSSLISIFDKLK